MRKVLQVVFYFAVFNVSAFATGQVTSSGGTANSVPKYSSTTAITDSAISDSGTAITVTEPLTVNGGSTGSGSPSFSVTGYQQYGIGIEFRLSNLTGYPESGATSSILFTGGNRPNGFSMIQSGGTDYSGGNGFLGFQTTAGGVLSEVMRLSPAGYVGIGTTTPGSKLEVKGNIAITSGSGGALIFADGTTQTTAFNPANCGADYAESVGVTGERSNYAPGDILVIDPAAPGKFLKSNQPYSTMVAGVYSTQPGFLGRLHPRDALTDATEVPMAMVGRVPTKVSAENGPIHVGDLLVSSSKLGYAMKGTDRGQMLGAVIGKALDSLDTGTGVIQVLVTLQ